MENFSPAAKQEKKKIVIVDTSEGMENEVRDVADANLTAFKSELRGPRGFLKKIWNYGLAEEYYRQKEIAKVRKKVLKSDNIYAGEDDDRFAHVQTMGAIVESFSAEYEEFLNKKDTGAKKEMLGESLAEKEVKLQIKGLIKDYVVGTLDEANFMEEKNRIFSALKGARKDVVDKGSMFADNFLEIADNIKKSVEHGQKMEELDLDFDFVIGKAKMGARTEAQFNNIDRLTEKIASSKIGGFVNEATIASAVAITYSLGTFVSKRMMNNKILAWGSFGATAGLATIFSGMRESRRLEEDRRHHAREMVKGKKFDPNKSPRRKEMEEFRQETRKANGLTDSLESGLYNFKEGKKETKQLTQEEFNKTLANLAEIESRVKISDQQKIDLISFSDSKKVDIERLRMDIARAQAKIELRKIIETNPEFLAGGKSFDELLQSVQETRMKQLIEGDGGIEKKNVSFKKMKHKKVAKSMIKGLAIGLTIGAAAQEIGAVFKGDQEGLMDVRSVFGANGASPAEAQHYTVLEYLRRLATNDFPKADELGAMHALVVGGHHISMPEGSNLIPNPDGSFSLTRGSETLLNHITFDPNGGLSAESRKLLESHGIDAVSGAIPGGASHGHNLATQGVHRTLWYDNDTPKPIFDKNELKLHWGGHQGTGVDSHGNYVFNVKDMTNDGSYHDRVSLSVHDAAAGGKLKMLFSLSQATQNQAVEVPIDAAGNVSIDPQSELGKMLFKTTNGHAEFLGKYAEVAEVVGNKNGIDQVRILATHVGHGIGAVEGTAPVTIFVVPPGEVPDYIVDPPPFIPVFGRNPLESTGKEGVGATPVRPENISSDPGEPSNDSEPEDETEAEKNRFAAEAAAAAAAMGAAAGYKKATENSAAADNETEKEASQESHELSEALKDIGITEDEFKWISTNGKIGRIQSAEFMELIKRVYKIEKPVDEINSADIKKAYRKFAKDWHSDLPDAAYSENIRNNIFNIGSILHREYNKRKRDADSAAAPSSSMGNENKKDQDNSSAASGAAAEKNSEAKENPITRAAAWHTVNKLDKFESLNGATPEEREENFKRLTRELWTDFTVHGFARLDAATGKWEVEKRSDLDGNSCLKLMELAGMQVDMNKVNFVQPGGTADSGIIMDTSEKHGVIADKDGERVIFDHHGKESDRSTSATKFVYEALVGLGLLDEKQQAYLGKYVEFVTKYDNLDFGSEEKAVYANYHQNLYGLSAKMKVEDVLALITQDVDPKASLPLGYLKKHTYINPSNGKEQTLAQFSKFFGGQMRSGEKEIAKLRSKGFVLETGDQRFGKVLIDIKKRNEHGGWYNKVNGDGPSRQLAAFAKGYGAYVVWSPDEKKFYVYTKKVMDEGFIPGGFSQGKNMRRHMLISGSMNTEPVKPEFLQEILSKLSGKADFKIEGRLKKIIDLDARVSVLMGLFDDGKLTEADLRKTAGDFKVRIDKVWAEMIDQRDKLDKEFQERVAKQPADKRTLADRNRIAIDLLIQAQKKTSSKAQPAGSPSQQPPTPS